MRNRRIRPGAQDQSLGLANENIVDAEFTEVEDDGSTTESA
jgi:hypothetical protein